MSLQKVTTVLFLSGEPVSVSHIAKLCNMLPDEVAALLPQIEVLLSPLGLQLLNQGKMLSIVTNPAQAGLIETFWKEELRGELTSAALQVLTLVAYLPGCTRQDISFIRGVQSAQSIRTLAVRGLIEREGEACKLSAQAMRHLGITTLEELPDYTNIRTELMERLQQARGEV